MQKPPARAVPTRVCVRVYERICARVTWPPFRRSPRRLFMSRLYYLHLNIDNACTFVAVPEDKIKSLPEGWDGGFIGIV